MPNNNRGWDGVERRQENLQRLHDLLNDSEGDRKVIHAKLDELEKKIDDVLDLLKIGKAGIAFVKWITSIGTAAVIFWITVSEFWKRNHT